MKKDAIILGVTTAVIVAGITGAVIAGKLKKQEVAEVPNDGAGEPPTTEEEQEVYEAGVFCSYTGKMEISNVKITLDEINQLKVYTLEPPKDESDYILALAKDFLEEDFEKADVSTHSHEESAGPLLEGWGNQYVYTDKENGKLLFTGGLYCSYSNGIGREVGDNTEELIAWIQELIDRNHLGIQGEGIHMEYDSTTLRDTYTCIPYFGQIPKASSNICSTGSRDEQGAWYGGYYDMKFQHAGGILIDAWMYSMAESEETGLSKSYSSFEEIYQLVYDSLASQAVETLYHEVVLDRMELYYNIGIKKDGTFVATPWVSFTGQEKDYFIEWSVLNNQKATYNVNLETGRVYQGG